MLTVREVAQLARNMTAFDVAEQLGPFVLLQQPFLGSHAAMLLGLSDQTTAQPKENVYTPPPLDDLLVLTIPPLAAGTDEPLSIGRAPDCDLVVDHPSVSRKHARLIWHPAASNAEIEDVGSSLGTFVNGSRVNTRADVSDMDAVTFGDAHFFFMLVGTLIHRIHLAHNPPA